MEKHENSDIVLSDKFDDPQAFVLSPDVAVEIANSIVSENTGYYRRAKAACRKTELMEDSQRLHLSPPEHRFLSNVKNVIDSLPEDEETFRGKICTFFSGKVPTFRERDYWA